jgi:DnaK suppressor protein
MGRSGVLVMEVQMDQKRVHALLREERDRLERLRSLVDADHDRVARADEVAEDLADGADRRTVQETDEAVARQLTSRLEALQRAEDRLAAGTYGRSVLSGRPIPDERLQAFPLAELTADEEAAQDRTDRPVVQAVERAADGEDGATVDGEDRAGRSHDRLDAARLGPSREPFQVLNDPAVQDNQLVEDDETTFPSQTAAATGPRACPQGLITVHLARIPSITFPKGGRHDRAGQHGWRYRGRQPGDR